MIQSQQWRNVAKVTIKKVRIVSICLGFIGNGMGSLRKRSCFEVLLNGFDETEKVVMVFSHHGEELLVGNHPVPVNPSVSEIKKRLETLRKRFGRMPLCPSARRV